MERKYRYSKTTKIKEDYTLNPRSKSLSDADLAGIYHRLAKTTNQRMLRLERSASAITGESYASYGAYPLIADYLESKGRRRFRETIKLKDGALENRALVQNEIAKMQNFLNSKSSTVGGQKEVERKRMETFGREHKTSSGKTMKALNFANNKEFYDFFKTRAYKKLAESFNSSTVLEAYDSMINKLVSERDDIDAMLAKMSKQERDQWKREHKYRRLSDDSIMKKVQKELESYRKSTGKKNLKSLQALNNAITLK